MADDSRRSTGKAGNSGDFGPEPQVVGVNQLQQSIDDFNKAVNKLSETADKFERSFQGGQSSYGHYTASPQQQAGPPSLGGGYAQALPGMGLGPPRSAGQPGYSPVGNIPPPAIPPPGQGPSQGPGNGGYKQSPFPPPQGLAKVAGFHIPYTKGSRAAGFLGAAAAISGMGENQFQTQVNMSSFVQQQQLMAPGNFTGQSFASAARFQAYGSGNRNLNSVAFNAQDASSGQYILSQLAGQSANRMGRYSTSFGRAGQAATNMFGYANPGLGYAGSANLASTLYSPITSLRMMQLGYQTPLNPQGGQARRPGQVISSLTQQLFHTGKGGISPQSLAFQLRSGGPGIYALQQATGISDPGQLQALVSTMLSQDRLTQGSGGQKKLTPQQAQNLMNSASRGNTAAQNTLSHYGVDRSDLQNIKNANAAKTGTSADVADAFNSGLQAATSSLTAFRKVLDAIARTPFGQAGAGAGGFAGTLASIANPGGIVGLGGSIAQIAMLKKLSTAMKTGGTTAATKALTGAGAAGAAAKTGGIGAAVDSALPYAASAAFMYAATHIKIPGTHGKTLWQMGDVTPGQPGGLFGQKGGTPGANPMNSWGQLFHDIGSGVSAPFKSLFGSGTPSWIQQLSKNGPAQAAPGGTHTSGQKFKGPGPGKSPKTGISAAAVTAVMDAKKELGVPYQYGGESPGVGFDCSGLVQWSYGQAGVALPRTSEDQYAATKGRSIDLTKVQAGDLVFQGGADGTSNNPGHVALMSSQTQIIEAPHQGLNVRTRAYSDKEWTHATRPTGGLGGSASLPIGSRSNNPNGPIGNHGLSASAGMGMGGNYGSSEEVDNVAAALMSMGGGGGGTSAPTTTGGAGAGGKSRSVGPVSTTGGTGSSSAAQAYAKSLFSKFGWGSDQMSSLKLLWNGESGWSSTAWNASGAYGIAQALGHGKGTGAVGPRSVGSTKPGFNASYGPQYGLTAAQARQANAGSYQPQVLWGEGYIKQRYSDPQGALYAWNSRQPHWYSTGTGSAPPGMAWTGERGPELTYLSGGQAINTAAQSFAMIQAQKRSAERPHQAHLPNGLSTSATHDVPIKVDLHFDKGSICISAENKDAQQVAEEFAASVQRVMAENHTLKAVASGRNHG